MKEEVERTFCDIGGCKHDGSKNETNHKCAECGKDICDGGWARWDGWAMEHTVKVTVRLTDIYSFTLKLCPDCCLKLFKKYPWPKPRRD